MRVIAIAAVLVMFSGMTTFGTPDPKLASILDRSVQNTFHQFKGLRTNELAATLIDLRSGEPTTASYRGDVQVYPASVIKLFYLVAIHRWMEDGKAQDTPELRRAMKDMIVDSLNEATGLVVDTLTDTTSGPEMTESALKEWWDKRNAVNRYYTSLGYTHINVNKKPWCEGPYGREVQATKMFEPRRNWLTTDATARLMTEIVTQKAVTPKRCDEMLELLQRDPFSADKSNVQAHQYVGSALSQGSKVWSKAGWTDEVRHDCAYVELPNGAKFVLVVFTEHHSAEKQIIPSFAKEVVAGFTK